MSRVRKEVQAQNQDQAQGRRREEGQPQADPGWQVYLVRCADDTLYCGIARDLARRLAQHNGLVAGGARYTRGRRPVVLAASLSCASRAEALRLEARVKKMARADKIAFLSSRSSTS